jgi:sarcosine oxidase, subunit gamma
VTVEARSPFAGRAEDLTEVGAVEVPLLAQVSLRMDPIAASLLPFSLPLEPNTWTGSPAKEALWLGPDEWLLVGSPGTERDIVAELGSALAGEPHGAVDLSANRVAIDLTRDDALELLSRGCSLDLHPREWSEGMCAQTLLARIPVILQQREDATRVFVRPSFARYLLDWLLQATAADRRRGTRGTHDRPAT